MILQQMIALKYNNFFSSILNDVFPPNHPIDKFRVGYTPFWSVYYSEKNSIKDYTSYWYKNQKQDPCEKKKDHDIFKNNPLFIINEFFLTINDYCLSILKFEDELRGLLYKLKILKLDQNYNHSQLEVIISLEMLCLFFLNDYHEIQLDTISIKNVELKRFYKSVPYFIAKIKNETDHSKRSNIYILNSFTQKSISDSNEVKNIDNIKDYRYNQITVTSNYSQAFQSFKEYFADIPSDSIIFINTHGNDSEHYFEFYTKDKKAEKVFSKDLINLCGERSFKLFCVFSCAGDSFKQLKLKSEFVIIPTKSGFVLSEIFIKVFLYHYDNNLSIVDSFNIGKYATLFSSFNETTVELLVGDVI